MRLHLRTTENTKPVPFDYQRSLVGAFHKWLGKNKVHDGLSLYSLGWLQGGRQKGKDLHFPHGATWPISTPDKEILAKLVDSIQQDPKLAFGMQVQEVKIQLEPDFTEEHRFLVQSPVLVKRNEDSGRIAFYLYDDTKADALLTETLKNKLTKAGKEDLEISVAFDRSYPQAKTKLINYNGIRIKGSICPVILKGDPEAIAFAWNVGVGNSTGIGFGALK